MDLSGCRLGLPPTSVLICALACECKPPQAGWAAAKDALVQGSCTVTALLAWFANNSEISGRRKHWDQLPRSKSESLVCHFRAARPVLELPVWRMEAAVLVGVPPIQRNCDQRSATSRSMSLAKGWSAR